MEDLGCLLQVAFEVVSNSFEHHDILFLGGVVVRRHLDRNVEARQ